LMLGQKEKSTSSENLFSHDDSQFEFMLLYG
jgi:hypothetical protein